MRISILLIGFAITSCINSDEKAPLDLQGHRGARGILPENTIPSFLRAVDLCVNTLELDLVVTKGGELLVSHEPFISSEICLDPTGAEYSDSLAHTLNIYQMTYDQILEYDCGSKTHPRFLDQSSLTLKKPLLRQVVSEVHSYVEENKLKTPRYNIELKSQANTDNLYHPEPKEFCDLAYQQIGELLPWNRVTIQSFDFRILQYFHETYPEVKLVLLIENDLPYRGNLDSLGFLPEVYSCYFPLLSQKIVHDLKDQGIKVVPWTVNETKDMKRLIDWGVDGLISDYPNRYKEVK